METASTITRMRWGELGRKSDDIQESEAPLHALMTCGDFTHRNAGECNRWQKWLGMRLLREGREREERDSRQF